MESTPLYVTIGSVLGIISSIILLILHLQQVIQIIRTSCKWIQNWIISRLYKFNRWRWWRKCRPSLKIVSNNDLVIKSDGISYHIELVLTTKCINHNTKYRLDYDTFSIIEIHHKGKGWEKKPYQLPYAVGSGPGSRTLQPGADETMNHLFANKIPVKPLIGKTAVCKTIGHPLGNMQDTPYIPLYGKVKKEWRSKFKVNVTWVN
jgi:hypothetical protein